MGECGSTQRFRQDHCLPKLNRSTSIWRIVSVSRMHDIHRRCGTIYFFALLALSLLGAAHAAPSATDGRRLYAPCAVCHAPQGWGSPDGNIPSLAGQQKRYLERQLGNFESGARRDPAMQLVTNHPSFDKRHDVAAIASYLSELNVNPDPSQGAGDHLRIGQEVYTHICAACHGFAGEGKSSNAVPRIAGQQYPYLRRQIEKAAQLHFDLAPAEMASSLRGMRDQEKDALADYTSRLTNENVRLDTQR